MKKTSKMFGAVALSAALAMGMAMPAFATAPTDDGKNGVLETQDVNIDNTADKKTTQQSSTEVFLNATNTQIKATIPLKIAVYATTDGGALMTPREYAYTITNESDNNAKLYLTKVDARLLGDGTPSGTNVVTTPWSAALSTDLADALSGAIAKNESSTATPASMTDRDLIEAKNQELFGSDTNKALTVKPTIGSVYMQMTIGQLASTYKPADTTDPNSGKGYAGGKSYIDVKDQNLIKLIHAGNYYTENPVDIEIDAKGAEGGTLGIRLEGATSQLQILEGTNGGITPDTMVSLMQVTYTVKASAAYLEGFDLHKISADDDTSSNFDYIGHLA